jgi:flagellar L-ring protein FlgH
MNSIIVSFLLFLVSCSNYVNQVHRQIEREEKVTNQGTAGRANRPYVPFRQQNNFRPENDKRPIKNPVTYSLGSGSSGTMRPPIRREYRAQRLSANDFRDNDNNGSLWANQGTTASLFTNQNDKNTGDLVIINVLEDLKNQISVELKRTFPDRPKKKTEDNKPKVEEKTASDAAASTEEMDMKVYDKISGIVMEEINRDYILLRGNKEVIFKKEKRSIEIQALVSRKDIMENDYVNSDKLLEPRVFILGNN